MTEGAVVEAYDHLQRLHHALQQPAEGGSLDWLKAQCVGLCLPWTMRAVESALAVATLRRAGLGHTTQPLNRLVLELSASVHWLIGADDVALAGAAVEAEWLRNLTNQNKRLISFGVETDVQDQLQGQIIDYHRRLTEVELSLNSDARGEYKKRKAQFRNFDQLLKAAGLSRWYVLFECVSTDSHRSAHARSKYVDLSDKDVVALSAAPSGQTVLALPFVAALATAAVEKLQDYSHVFHQDVMDAVSNLNSWYEKTQSALGVGAAYFEPLP